MRYSLCYVQFPLNCLSAAIIFDISVPGNVAMLIADRYNEALRPLFQVAYLDAQFVFLHKNTVLTITTRIYTGSLSSL